jgi:hypothetical protein
MKTQMDNHHSDGTILTTCSQLLSKSLVIGWSPEDAMNAIHMRESGCYVSAQCNWTFGLVTHWDSKDNSRVHPFAALSCDEYTKISPLSRPTASRRLHQHFSQ